MEPPTFLTSWKEIAQHVGKSVRTVQRWERDMGLPVRRPDGTSPKIMLIETSALDHWIRCTFHQDQSLPIEMNWEMLDRSRQLIAETVTLRRDHSILVQKSQTIRDELAKSRLYYLDRRCDKVASA